MRLNSLKYVGESIPCRGSTLLGNAESAWDAAAAGAEVVRSSINARRLADPALDLAAIEREAREAQSAWIASNLKSFFAALAQKLSRRGHARNDERPDATQSMDTSGISTPAEKASLPHPVARTF